MTGIERLRDWAEDMSWDFGDTGKRWAKKMNDIADQIERETTPQERRDEPADDHAKDVSVSAYDLLPPEDREAIAWVREHGGLSHVKDIYHDLRAVVERLGIEWSESELHGLMAALDRRLMPEGYEWPRFEDGELVQIGATFAEKGTIKNVVASVELSDDWFAVHGFDGAIDKYSKGERVKRPAVLAADGEPLEVGQTVWDTNGDELVIGAIEDGGHTVACRYADAGDGIPVHGMWSPSDLTHQRPVLDADGVPIKKGDTVYLLPGEWCDEFPCLGFHGGEELEVFADEEALHVSGGVQCREKGKKVGFRGHCYPQPSQLTHTKPEIDSWERIEEDKDLNPFDCCKKVGHKLWTFDNAEEFKASDLVRRCRALAERERGE